jgi:PhnB protein
MAYITPKNATEAIEFYKRAFGATERMRMPAPGGKIGHAELGFRDSVLMLADEPEEALTGYQAPSTLGGTSFAFTMFVDDVDTVFQQAVQAGAKPIREPQTEFYGDREGRVEDPYGYVWSLMTHVEDVSPEELQRRAAQQTQGGS